MGISLLLTYSRRPGMLTRAISVMGLFVPSGVIWMTRRLRPSSSLTELALVIKPLVAKISATRSLTLLCGRSISCLLTAMALRMRVSISAIGSVDVIAVLLIGL